MLLYCGQVHAADIKLDAIEKLITSSARPSGFVDRPSGHPTCRYQPAAFTINNGGIVIDNAGLGGLIYKYEYGYGTPLSPHKKVIVRLTDEKTSRTHDFVIRMSKYLYSEKNHNINNTYNLNCTHHGSSISNLYFLLDKRDNPKIPVGHWKGSFNMSAYGVVDKINYGEITVDVDLNFPLEISFSLPSNDMKLSMVDSSEPLGSYSVRSAIEYRTNALSKINYKLMLQCGVSDGSGNCQMEDSDNVWSYSVYVNNEQLKVGVENKTALQQLANRTSIPLQITAKDPPAAGRYQGNFTLLFEADW